MPMLPALSSLDSRQPVCPSPAEAFADPTDGGFGTAASRQLEYMRFSWLLLVSVHVKLYGLCSTLATLFHKSGGWKSYQFRGTGKHFKPSI